MVWIGRFASPDQGHDGEHWQIGQEGQSYAQRRVGCDSG
jgi:hypothetical protein